MHRVVLGACVDADKVPHTCKHICMPLPSAALGTPSSYLAVPFPRVTEMEMRGHLARPLRRYPQARQAGLVCPGPCSGPTPFVQRPCGREKLGDIWVLLL